MRILKGFKSCVLEVRILNGLWVCFSEVRILKELRTVRRIRREKAGRYPTPECFLQERQTEDLCLTWLVRVANVGLKVVVFSATCRELVRVAGKGVARERCKVESLKSKG